MAPEPRLQHPIPPAESIEEFKTLCRQHGIQIADGKAFDLARRLLHLWWIGTHPLLKEQGDGPESPSPDLH